MAFQHREFQTQLREAERLRLYTQSTFSNKKALSGSLMEAESNSRHLESEAIEAVEMTVRAEAERDAARNEVAMARLEIVAASSARAQMESKLARVQRKVESELDVA